MNWLLLRGLYREQRHWGELPSILADRARASSVLALDNPGCGTESGCAEVPWSVAGMTEHLRVRWLARRAPGEWGLLAISLGGMVALDWCDRYPSDFGRAVLVNPSARGLGSPLERFNPRFYPELLRLLLTRDERTREMGILRMTSNLRDAALDAVLLRNVEIARRTPIPSSVFARQLAAAARFEAPARLEVPALVLRSLGDRLVSPACSARLARRLGAPCIDHPWGGHDLTLDDPEWVARAVGDHGL